MGEIKPIKQDSNMRVLRDAYDLEIYKRGDVLLRDFATSQHALEMRGVCAAGSPGIGKSTTASILIRMLLKEGCIVVYYVRSHKEVGWVFEFSPPGDGSVVTEEVYPERGHISAIKSLDSHKKCYVV
jgi:hypothetical protein